MTNISPIADSVQPTSLGVTSSKKENENGALISADFETFLRLLTTQMENQDPTKPLESTEFVAQLASFSAVEQQINTNNKLDTLADVLAGSSVGTLAGWLGKSVRSTAPFDYQNGTVEVFYDMPANAQSAELVVKNDVGSEVNRIPIGLDGSSYVWDGLDQKGQQAPLGGYRFELETKDDSARLSSISGETYSNVSEARYENGVVNLTVGQGHKIEVGTDVSLRLAQ